MHMTRKVFMLYPDANAVDDFEERQRLFKLIDSIAFIIRAANEKVQLMISKNQKLFFENLMPRVELKAMNYYMQESGQDNGICMDDSDDLRICLTKFEAQSYEDYYHSVLIPEEFEAHNISHLIAVQLTKKGKPQWKPASSENRVFDALVSTTLNDLEDILISIMLDIILYHSFGLPLDYQIRRLFSKVKREYIMDNYGNSEIAKYYGSRQELEKIRYLPLSTKYVKNVNECFEMKELLCVFVELIQTKVLLQYNYSSKQFGQDRLENNENAHDLRSHTKELDEAFEEYAKTNVSTSVCMCLRKKGNNKVQCTPIPAERIMEVFHSERANKDIHFIMVCNEEV